MKKQKTEQENPTIDRGVWEWLRMSFWAMVGFYAIIILQSEIIAFVFLAAIAGTSTFILSIIHLTKYKEKMFAIIALIVSALFVVIPFWTGFMMGIQGV